MTRQTALEIDLSDHCHYCGYVFDPWEHLEELDGVAACDGCRETYDSLLDLDNEGRKEVK